MLGKTRSGLLDLPFKWAFREDLAEMEADFLAELMEEAVEFDLEVLLL